MEGWKEKDVEGGWKGKHIGWKGKYVEGNGGGKMCNGGKGETYLGWNVEIWCELN